MRGELLEKRLSTAMRKVAILERMVEDSTRSLYLEKESLRAQWDFLNNILESLGHPLYILDANDYAVKLANSAACVDDSYKGKKCFDHV